MEVGRFSNLFCTFLIVFKVNYSSAYGFSKNVSCNFSFFLCGFYCKNSTHKKQEQEVEAVKDELARCVLRLVSFKSKQFKPRMRGKSYKLSRVTIFFPTIIGLGQSSR